jgi:hypothetical protein
MGRPGKNSPYRRPTFYSVASTPKLSPDLPSDDAQEAEPLLEPSLITALDLNLKA